MMTDQNQTRKNNAYRYPEIIKAFERVLAMSESMIECPYCERRVLSLNGVCPSCNGNLGDEAAVRRSIVKRDALAIARAARAKCATFSEIKTELIKGGVDEDLIKEIMADVEGKTPEAMEKKNELDMRRGLYWLIGGILVTAVTYSLASSSKNGGVYIIAWGPVVAGGIQFIRALVKSK